MYADFKVHLKNEINNIKSAGLYKHEQTITTAQGAHVGIENSNNVLNLCANNYLGLAQHPKVNDAAQQALAQWGYGMASVRFICGTQTPHKQLEQAISDLLQMEETILYPSCFDANGGLFETLLTDEDAIISDALNHASIIDGVRLSKATRYRYKNNDMADLERQLQQARHNKARFILITTDGVFSMDGSIAHLDTICELAQKYQALVHFDDCHATGIIGANGRGTHEYRQCMDRVDITTGTLGKALGGGSGGYTSGRKEIIELLRQRSRPYLFSNTIAPPIVGGALKAIALAKDNTPRTTLARHSARFRQGLSDAGFNLLAGNHPIIPVMLYDANLATQFAQALRQEGIYVSAFSYPVVPKQQARIRTQMSAAFSDADIDFAISAFIKVKQTLGSVDVS